MEMKKFLKNPSSKKSFYGLLYNKQPEFFSSTLSYIVNTINYFLFLYVVFSLLIYLFFHFFALNINTFKITEATYTPMDSSLSLHNFNNLFFLVIIVFGILALKQETFMFFILYMGSFGFFSLSYLIRGNYTFVEPLSYSFTIFNLISIGCFLLLSAYTIMFYCKSVGYLRFNLNDVPYDEIIHEVKLRTDLAKMNYNALMIRLGLHKISKKLLYTKKDYYFMNMEKERENNEAIRREFANEQKNANTSFSYKSDDETFANTVENTYSRIDSEYEPLKN